MATARPPSVFHGVHSNENNTNAVVPMDLRWRATNSERSGEQPTTTWFAPPRPLERGSMYEIWYRGGSGASCPRKDTPVTREIKDSYRQYPTVNNIAPNDDD